MGQLYTFALMLSLLGRYFNKYV